MSLLMMLTTPFANLNILSNATAQGYNDNYYEERKYSKYPTDDKKYECRTGPFEGFFVSSVEFCKHLKFDKDDKRDSNRTETQGPSTTDSYTVTGDPVPVPSSLSSSPPLFRSSIANCDAGDTVSGGGYTTTGGAQIKSSKPLATENGWNATASNIPGIAPAPGQSVTAVAICSDHPPLRP